MTRSRVSTLRQSSLVVSGLWGGIAQVSITRGYQNGNDRPHVIPTRRSDGENAKIPFHLLVELAHPSHPSRIINIVQRCVDSAKRSHEHRAVITPGKVFEQTVQILDVAGEDKGKGTMVRCIEVLPNLA